MTFTIRCDECGKEQIFKNGDKARNTKIDLEIRESGGYQPYPTEINVYCENPNCNNMVGLDY